MDPSFPAGDDHPVEIGMARQQIGGCLLDDPGNVGVGMAAAEGGERRQRVDHIADGAQFDDQDVHGLRFLRIHCTPARRSPAMCTGRTIPVSRWAPAFSMGTRCGIMAGTR